jgi:ribosomal protein S27AE
MCRISDDGKAITCLKCGMTSHNPNDVAHRYCGRCHIYHFYEAEETPPVKDRDEKGEQT